MPSNQFGNIFRITTWGESHGKAIGVVIDGCPAGLELSREDIQTELDQRKPGRTKWVSPRKEPDLVEIFSGIFEGKTTGAPISIVIFNQDVEQKSYSNLKDVYRPGHANFSYLEKYKIFDYLGGGRASARETTCRVAAGAIAKKILYRFGIKTLAYLHQIGDISIEHFQEDFDTLYNKTFQDVLFCPEENTSKKMMEELKKVQEEGDSIGGIVAFRASGVPVGLGEPIYQKIEAMLAQAMLSIPASKGFEIGSGFKSATMNGFEHNDSPSLEGEKIRFTTNYSGGVLGGISNGMDIYGKVAFKPTSSIKKEQETVSLDKKKTFFSIRKEGRHDPCIAIRATKVVEAMLAVCLVDCLLLKQSNRLDLICCD